MNNQCNSFCQVLLGDGYYAERTSKQTVEILKRRGKILESQFESLKADIQDLKTEASFFNATANEAAVSLFICIGAWVLYMCLNILQFNNPGFKILFLSLYSSISK